MNIWQRKASSVIIFFSIFLFFAFTHVHTAFAWVDGYNYRKSITVNGSSTGSQTDYQLKIVVYKTTGSDTGNTVYLDGKVKNDYSDLRFTDSNGTLLNYWIEQINADNAEVWVKFNSIPTSGAQFYLYYNNPDATTLSSFPNTFTMLTNGDFESGDFTGWTTYDAYENWGSKGTYNASISSSDPIEGQYSAFLNASGGDTQVTGKASDVSGLDIKGWDNKALVFRVNATVNTSGTWPGQPYNFVSAMIVDLIYSDGTTDSSYEKWYGYSHSASITTDFLNEDFNVLGLKDIVSSTVKNESNNYELETVRINARHKYSSAEGYWDVIGFANYLSSNAPSIAGWSGVETPSSGQSGSSTSSTSSSSRPPSCTDSVPGSVPDLFQIDVSNTQAILFFVPASSHVNKYYIAYGHEPGDNRFGIEYSQPASNGVLSYQVNSLLPNTTYYFRIRAGNGCMPGDWSNEIKIKTANALHKGITYYKNLLPKILNTFPIKY